MNSRFSFCQIGRILSVIFALTGVCVIGEEEDSRKILYHDAHFHTTNYIQEGVTMDEALALFGDRIGRFVAMGIPLQQKWDYFVSGERAPDYYLRSAASLYYYSFVDAVLASQYMKLSDEQKKRVDPMISGFNPTDMYAGDHIKRVLLSFPGVFSAVGEFSVHKEFVSSKVTGHAASLHNPALDRIFETLAEIGIVGVIHCDIDNVRPGEKPDHYSDLVDLFKRHPNTKIIWAHTGLGRFVKPGVDHVQLVDAMMSDPELDHVFADISWDLVNEYMVADEATSKSWAELLNKHPTRFLFGSDAVAPSSWEGYNQSYEILESLWAQLTDEAMHLVTIGNYERIFDESIARTRAWEHQALQGE